MHTFYSQFRKPPDCIWRLLIDCTIKRKRRSCLLSRHNDCSLVTGIRHWSVWLGDSRIKFGSSAALSRFLFWLILLLIRFFYFVCSYGVWVSASRLPGLLRDLVFGFRESLGITGAFSHYSRPSHLIVYLEGGQEVSRRRCRATFAEVLPTWSPQTHR